MVAGCFSNRRDDVAGKRLNATRRNLGRARRAAFDAGVFMGPQARRSLMHGREEIIRLDGGPSPRGALSLSNIDAAKNTDELAVHWHRSVPLNLNVAKRSRWDEDDAR